MNCDISVAILTSGVSLEKNPFKSLAEATKDVLNFRFAPEDHPYEQSHYRQISSASREMKFKDSCAPPSDNKDGEKVLLVCFILKNKKKSLCIKIIYNWISTSKFINSFRKNNSLLIHFQKFDFS